MGRYLETARRLLPVGALLLIIQSSRLAILLGQGSPTNRVMVCESTIDACSRSDAPLDIVWTFDGTAGTITYPDGQAGTRLTIERFDADSIVVSRVDQSGPTAGLTAVYTGRVRGIRIIGTVEWSWPNHAGYPAKGSFAAKLEDQGSAVDNSGGTATTANPPQVAMPAELLVCENGGPCNAAWIFHGTSGTGTWFSQKSTRAALTIERYEPGYILIRRTDTTDGISARYAGSWRGDHYSGTIVWSSPGHPGDRTGSWTATQPNTTCAEQAGLEAEDAMQIGQYALMFKRDRDAFNCYLVAARTGNATAQTAVGLLFYQGRGDIAQDYAQAFFWLRKAADQKIYAAERTVAEMYTAGLGTQRDPNMASIYGARADEQKHDMERRQDFEERAQARREEHAERAADRATQLLSSFVLGASFGLFF